MDLAIGSFVQPTATGSQAVTGVGFQPKAIILFMTQLTADGTAIHCEFGYGISTSATERRAFTGTAEDALNSAGKTGKNLAIDISSGGTGPVTDAQADFTSFDADGFTIDWTTVDSTLRIGNYIAFAGADLSVDESLLSSLTSLGLSVETTAFEPDVVLFLGAQEGFPGSANDLEHTMGAAIDASNEASVGFRKSSGGTTGGSLRTDLTNIIVSNGTTYQAHAQFDSKSATDFTLDWTKISGTSWSSAWLALQGINAKVGSFNLSTSLGNQSVTGVGFRPDGVILFSGNAVASGSPSANTAFSYGAAISSSSRFVVSIDSPGAAKDTSLSRTKVFQALTAGTPTIDADADLVSLDADGFTIENETVDATSREVAYVAFGTIPGPAPNLEFVSIEGRLISVRGISDIVAVEEQITEKRSAVFTGARSKLYLADFAGVVRGSKAATVAIIQSFGGFLDTDIFTVDEGRKIEIDNKSITAIREGLIDVRDPVYQDVRSDILFGFSHTVTVRERASVVVDGVGPVNTGVVLVIGTSYTVIEGDRLILVDDDLAGGPVTINLPEAEFLAGREIAVKKLGTTATVTIDPSGTEELDGELTLDIIFQFDAPNFMCDGFGWQLL